MNLGILFDSHALLWFSRGDSLAPSALFELASAAASARLFASHITIWEIGVSLLKKQIHLVPDLGGRSPGGWFSQETNQAHAIPVPISAEIAAEAALVPAVSLYGDPGDCFLIATCRVHHLALVTRDTRILQLAERNPSYLRVIPC
jgi:PIN domain nuclease of toxin-antitoxin system